MDLETARANMIEQQIRPWNVLEIQTLSALNDVKREDFVPEESRGLAFTDVQIPLVDGQFMLEPKVAARMVEVLHLNSTHNVLQIGTGTGYVTALIASLGGHVTSIEISQALHDKAGIILGMTGFDNINLVHSDCFEYCENQSDIKFDRVLVTGSVPNLDDLFQGVVSDDGYVIGIEGSEPAMHVVKIDKDGNRHSLFDTVVPRLRNVEDPQSFEF